MGEHVPDLAYLEHCKRTAFAVIRTTTESMRCLDDTYKKGIDVSYYVVNHTILQ